MEDRLDECGFLRGKKCLILMEGLIMYLQPESVEALFRCLQDYTGAGSKIVFDFIYASVKNQESRYAGEDRLTACVSKNGESFCFGFEAEDIPRFLGTYGFSLEDLADSAELENRYFRNSDGTIGASVNATHGIATAAKV
jgi:O-methyltransferase involved in polyketide biosynthesis